MSNVNVIGARKAAKNIARNQGVTHQQALDRVAVDRGFAHWGELLAAAGPARPSNEASLDGLLELGMSIGATSVHIEQTVVGGRTAKLHSMIFMRIDGERRLVHESEGTLSMKLGRLVCERACMPSTGFKAASGRLKLRSGVQADVAMTSSSMDDTHERRLSNVVVRLPWLRPALAIDDLGERRGDGWEAVMSASTGLIVIGGRTNTMKTTLAHLLVDERRSGGMDTLLVDDVCDHDGLLAAIRSSREKSVIVVLHAVGIGDVLARLAALAGPQALREAAVAAIVGSRRVPRMCGACGGYGCRSCDGSGTSGSGVLMVAEKVSGAADLIARASVTKREGDFSEIARLSAVVNSHEFVGSVDVRTSTLAEIDRILNRMARNMSRATLGHGQGPASSRLA